jgi:hypothetical protein
MPDDDLEGGGGGGAGVDEELEQVLHAGDGGLGVDDELEQVLAGDGLSASSKLLATYSTTRTSPG